MEIIAEVAQGYEGSPRTLALLTKAGLTTGADALKFQLVYADELACPDYQYYDLFRQLELPLEIWDANCEVIKNAGKKVFFDIFGPKSFSVAAELSAHGVKISTTEFYNFDLILKSLDIFESIYISVGGIPVNDIDELYSLIPEEQFPKICFLHGLQAEPTPMAENNLLRIKSIKNRFPLVRVGFMDHSDGGTVESRLLPIMATALGVDVIEKHITLDRELELEDFVSGLPPSQFKAFCSDIRTCREALGSESFVLTDLELEYRRKAIKTVVANNVINQGHLIEECDLSLKRTGREIESSLHRIRDVVGKVAPREFMKNEPFNGSEF